MSASAEVVVELQGIEKQYQLGSTSVRALSAVDLQVRRGDFVLLLGPSGSGKTTLLNLVGCIDVPSRGVVRLLGAETTALSDRALTELRLRHVGFVFQAFNLLPALTALQNVEVPLLLRGELSRGERRARVEELLLKVGLKDHALHRPSELSGGQRQRVAIARALVTRPDIVLADEPTANLDSATGKSILDLMRELNSEDGTTFLVSSHDPRVVDYARRIVRVADGVAREEQEAQ